ncbi:MAG: hypothetical protein Q7S15_01745 [bacterium]|nr:hypothetical protein [bacterium]
MGLFAIVPYYVRWHYTVALFDFYRLFANAWWFIQHFFSLRLLAKTFFVPFMRLHESYQKGFNLENFFGALMVNILMRLVGSAIRSIFIVIGILSLVTAILLGAALFAVWLVFPLLIAALFVMGLSKFAFL